MPNKGTENFWSQYKPLLLACFGFFVLFGVLFVCVFVFCFVGGVVGFCFWFWFFFFTANMILWTV